jgi:Xaa-Pro aminopeptidase
MEKYKSMGLEEQHMTVAKLASLKKILPKAKWKAMSGVVEGLRIIKDAGEIKIIKKAVQIAVKTLADFSKTIQVGQSEADMEWNLLSLARKNGADGFSFPPIITFGKNTSDIHAQRGNAKLKKGEVVLIDSGIIYQGYITDMTRMFYLTKPKPVEQKMYSIVLAANQAGIKAVKVGAKFSDIDKAARKVIEDAGYGKYFSHSTGHGTGLEVHEAPTVSVHSKDKVEKGMVFTVEPGVYIDGIGGVRIEDMVYVNEKGGVEVLTDYPKIMK